MNELVHMLNKVPGTAIVYVRNRKKTKEIATILQQAGISADFFHAGINHAEKELKQQRWKSGECRVIVSTNAFGMGIDKPDVRLVVHIDMPGSLEEYYQEAGRAGRDEQRAYAVALCTGTDSAKLKKRLSDEFPERDFILRVYEALGNYYQIAVGFGLDTVHDFVLNEFCAAFKFPLLQTHHALKILELSGYIEYTDEIDNASRLLFKANKEDLYKYLHQDKQSDAIIQVILRSYTGLFADYAYINEALIATRANVSQQEVYDTLIGLSKYHIVKYIPHKKTPLIIYTQTREDLKYVVIPQVLSKSASNGLKPGFSGYWSISKKTAGAGAACCSNILAKMGRPTVDVAMFVLPETVRGCPITNSTPLKVPSRRLPDQHLWR
jgi:ATP-dependent DNA helicase RecQ (EC 3.6.1.-)